MPVLTVAANSYVETSFQVPRRAFVPYLSGPAITYHVEAEGPVTVYVVDGQGLQQFLKGEQVNAFAGGENKPKYLERVRLPLPVGSWWHLIILNRNAFPVAVYYEVRG